MQASDRARFTEFVQVAKQYCSLIDHVPEIGDDWLLPLCRLLPKLHAAVESLRDPGGHDVLVELADLDARFELFSRLHEELGRRDSYWMEFDEPVAGDAGHEHSMSGSLADDLTDIYFELKRGLQLLEAVSADEVAHLWQAGFQQHWGQHLVDAERHLYSLKVNNRLQ